MLWGKLNIRHKHALTEKAPVKAEIKTEQAFQLVISSEKVKKHECVDVFALNLN